MRQRPLLLLVLSFVIVLAALPVLPGAYWTGMLFEEGAAVETASAILWFVAAGLAALCFSISIRNRALFSLAFMLFALRELDFQSRFTEGTFIKINYYDDMSGLAHYLLGALAISMIAVIAAAFIVSLLHYRRNFLPKISAQWLLAGWGLVIFTKILDRAPAKFRNDLGVSLGDPVTKTMTALEEGLELLAPIVMIVAFRSSAPVFGKIRNGGAKGPPTPES